MYIDEKERKIVLRDGEKIKHCLIFFNKDLLREDINDYYSQERQKEEPPITYDWIDEILTTIRKKFKTRRSLRWIDIAEIETTSFTLDEITTDKHWEKPNITYKKSYILFKCEENISQNAAIDIYDLAKLSMCFPLLCDMCSFQLMKG